MAPRNAHQCHPPIITITGTKSAAGQVALQVGYTIADIAAKAGYGLLIYFMARAKSDAEGYNPDHASIVARVGAAV